MKIVSRNGRVYRTTQPRTIAIRACKACNRFFPVTNLHKRKTFCSYVCIGSAVAQKSRISFADRFWKYVEKSDGCWTWTGSRHRGGYGQINSSQNNSTGERHQPMPASRASWLVHFGEIGDGLEVCHRCDNPPCVRPDHLFLGTRQQNSEDKVRKGRQARGERSGVAKLTADQVIEIRRQFDSGRQQVLIAADFGIRAQHVRLIGRRTVWRSLPEVG